MTGLPGYLRGIGRVVADQTVASSPLALRVLSLKQARERQDEAGAHTANPISGDF